MTLAERLERAQVNTQAQLERATLRRYVNTVNPTASVVVCKVKGEDAVARLISAMKSKGYELDHLATRKQTFSPLTGLMTRKQIHTLIFNKTHD